jgi:hypothetical protein
MTRHGLQLPNPAITTTLETRTFTSVVALSRKMLRWSAKTSLRDMASSPNMRVTHTVRTATRQCSTGTADHTESEIPIVIA